MYTATITSASLRLRESRIIADLLLRDLEPHEWRDTLLGQNVLQMGSPESIKRIARLLRARLEPLGDTLWEMVRDGDRHLATQAAFAGATKNSRLLGDFLDIAIREQRALFNTHLNAHVWNDYIAGCRGRDPEMPLWSDQTLRRLRSAVFNILAETQYLDNTRNLRLQPVFVDPQLSAYLRERGESYVLRCMEVME